MQALDKGILLATVGEPHIVPIRTRSHLDSNVAVLGSKTPHQGPTFSYSPL